MMNDYFIATIRELSLFFGVLGVLGSFYISRGKRVPWEFSKISRLVFYGGLCLIVFGQFLFILIHLLRR